MRGQSDEPGRWPSASPSRGGDAVHQQGVVALTNRALAQAGLAVRVRSAEAALSVCANTSVLVAATEAALGEALDVQRQPRSAVERAHNVDAVVHALASRLHNWDASSVDASRVVAGCDAHVCLLLRGVLSAAEEGGEAEEDAALRGALDQVSLLLAQLRSAEGTEAEEAAAEARARRARPQTAPSSQQRRPHARSPPLPGAPPAPPRPPPPPPPSSFGSVRSEREAEARAARVAAARVVYAHLPPPPHAPASRPPPRPRSAPQRRRGLLSLLPAPRAHGASPAPWAYPHHLSLAQRTASRTGGSVASMRSDVQQQSDDGDVTSGEVRLPPDLSLRLAGLAKLQAAECARVARQDAAVSLKMEEAQRCFRERTEAHARILAEQLHARQAQERHAQQRAAAAAARNAACAARAAAARDAAAMAAGSQAVNARARDAYQGKERAFRALFLSAVEEERERILNQRRGAVESRREADARSARVMDAAQAAHEDAWRMLLERVEQNREAAALHAREEAQARWQTARWDRAAAAA